MYYILSVMGWITYTYSQYTRWETREYTTLLYYTLHQNDVDEKKTRQNLTLRRGDDEKKITVHLIFFAA